jgi:hypothetical protein
LWSTILFQYYRNLSDRSTEQQTGVKAYMFSRPTTASSHTHGFDVHNFDTLIEELCLHCLLTSYHNQFLYDLPMHFIQGYHMTVKIDDGGYPLEDDLLCVKTERYTVKSIYLVF